jgi:hypothetical protein
MPSIAPIIAILGARTAGSKMNWDAASAGSAFLHAVERELQSEADSIGPIMSDLMPAAEFVAMNPERYSANREIFGDFPAQLERIRELWCA